MPRQEEIYQGRQEIPFFFDFHSQSKASQTNRHLPLGVCLSEGIPDQTGCVCV